MASSRWGKAQRAWKSAASSRAAALSRPCSHIWGRTGSCRSPPRYRPSALLGKSYRRWKTVVLPRVVVAKGQETRTVGHPTAGPTGTPAIVERRGLILPAPGRAYAKILTCGVEFAPYLSDGKRPDPALVDQSDPISTRNSRKSGMIPGRVRFRAGKPTGDHGQGLPQNRPDEQNVRFACPWSLTRQERVLCTWDPVVPN